MAVALAICPIGCFNTKTTTGSATQPSEHDRLFVEGTELIAPYMTLQRGTRKDPRSSGARRDIIEGIHKLEQVIAINAKNWSAFWFIGKGYQVLGDSERAYASFKSAWDLHKQDSNVAREFMLACLALGRGSEGVAIAEHALKLKPKDPGLTANLALALLIDGQLDRAEHEVRESLAIDPEDSVTQELETTISDIKNGKRSRPMKLGDLAGATP